MLRKILAALGCALLVASCGGGGGGDSAPASNFRVNYDKSSLAFDQFEGFSTTPQTITATATGDPGGTVYVVVLVDGDHIAPSDVSISFGTTQAFITVMPRSDLAAGTYTGRLILQVCADRQCTRHFGGSPFTVTTSSVVHRSLRLTPAAVNLAAANAQSTRTRIDVQPAEGFGFTAQPDVNTPWASIENADATGFTLVTAPLPGGSYGGGIRVTSGPQDRTLVTSLTVAPGTSDTDLQVNPTGVTLNVGATGSASQLVTVTPPGWNSAVSASIDYNGGAAGWLTATDLGNTSWRLTGNAATLLPGTYSAVVTFRGTYPSVGRIVIVTFVVGTGLVAPAQVPVIVTSETTAGALSGTAPLALAGGGNFTWTASTLAPWLKLDTASGNQGVPLAWHVDTTELNSLPNFATQQAAVLVTTNVAVAASATIMVELTKQLPEVHAVAPYFLARNRAARVLVRGRGFDGVLNIASRLSIDGVTPVAVTRQSDAQIAVDLPALTAPATTVRVGNALGLASATGTLKTAAPPAFAYAALAPAPGNTRSLVYDAERRALYHVHSGSLTHGNALRRLVFNGTTWDSSTLIDDGLFDVALSLDGSNLHAVMVLNEMRWLDPATGIETRPRIGLGGTFTDDRDFFQLQGLSLTVDGRLWLPRDEALPGNLAKRLTFLDTRSGVVNDQFDPGGTFFFYRGPIFGVPRDGSRMMGRQNAGVSGPPSIADAIKYDALTNTVSHAPDVPQPFDVRFTHDGRLAVIDFNRVVDRNDGLHGLLRLPVASQDNWLKIAAQITGDGKRVYLLVYPTAAQGGDSSTSGIKPRVYVFDSTTATTNASGLPLLGYFELNDYPGGCPGTSTLCWLNVAATISPDDGTLFFAGGLHTLVVPVPGTLTPAAATPVQPARWQASSAQQ